MFFLGQLSKRLFQTFADTELLLQVLRVGLDRVQNGHFARLGSAQMEFASKLDSLLRRLD